MNKLSKRLLAVVLAATMVVPSSAYAVMAGETENDGVKHVQILQTSDIHGKFVPFKYATYEADTSGSLAQMATVIKQKEKEEPNSILIDVGDTIQDNSADIFLNDEQHPLMVGFNTLNYDYWVYGNHEFNYGVPALLKIEKQFKGTSLCGNVFDSNGSLVADKIYDIKEIDGVKVAVIGMVTPNITRWDSENLKAYKVTNPLDEVEKALAEIKKEDVDVTILAYHAGLDGEYDVKGSGAVDVAEAFPGEFDVILAAHGHTKAEERVNGTLIVENTSSGAMLSDIDLTLTPGESGDYTVTSSCEQVAIKGLEADAELLKVLAPFDEKAKSDAQTPVGKLIGGDLVKKTEITNITQAQTEESAMMNLINEVQMYYANAKSTEAKATVSAAAVFSYEANIQEGDIKKCDASLIYKYDNTIYKLKMTGKQLKQYMEWSASYFDTYKKGDLTIGFNDEMPAYLFDIFAGVKYDINISKEPGNRIENLTRVDGTKIKDSDEIIISVNNYRANSQLLQFGAVYHEENGDTLPVLVEKDCFDNGYVRDLIIKYIKEVKGGVIYPKYTGAWKITGNNWSVANRDKVVALSQAGLIEGKASADGKRINGVAITEDDLKAFASVKTARIKFDANGGVTNGDSICIVDGKSYGSVAKVFRDGYAFDGWFTDAKAGEAVTAEQIKALKADTTLYAHWTKIDEFVPVIKKVVSDTKSITVTLEEANVDSFTVTYATDKNFTKSVKSVEVKNSTTVKLEGLTSGKVYYIKAVAHMTDSLGYAKDSKESVVREKVTKMTAPKKASIKSLKAGKKSFTIKLNKIKNAKGYRIYYTTDKKFKKGVKHVDVTKTTATVKKLKSKKTYYVKVAAFVKDGKGKVYLGTKSATKKIKVK